MPRGLNRTDLNSTGTSYRNGNPVTLPKNFGNPITTPHDFGNDVTWTPSSAHFGNPITLPHDFGNIIGINPNLASGFELADGTGVLLLENGFILLLEQQ